GLALEMKTLEQERVEARRQLELATTKSDRHGVLTWVIDEEGATVQKGAVLARIADLSAFRVEATVSDVHANRLSFGQAVRVKVNDELTLSGAIARINPTVNNGVITLVVGLEDKSNAQLRSNLRVDVLIGAERKDGVLRVRKGPSVGGEGVRDIFVIRGDVALKTAAKFGVAGARSDERRVGKGGGGGRGVQTCALRIVALVAGLEDKANAQLRSNLRVDVLIGAERKDGVLRVRKGPSVGGEGVRDIFVIRGDVALKTAAKFGVAGA